MKKLLLILLVILEALLLLLGLGWILMGTPGFPEPTVTQPTTLPTTVPTTVPPETTLPVTVPPTTEETVPPTTEPVTEPTEPPLVFLPQYTDSSNPDNWNTRWEIIVDGKVTDSYTREDPIFFEDGDYFALPGVPTFRGSNYRGDGSYGTAQITEGTLNPIWRKVVGYLSEAKWTGCGWTGQPLVVQWDDETKAIMNLYEDKKAKEGLVEVIYAKMDGTVHFFDMEDGTPTRDPIRVGMVFKGSGALDPRGYPLLYLGAGLKEGGTSQAIFVVSLIDGSILYRQSGADKMAYRGWYAFDSSPLVDPETDTLLWPCESGILYTMKLNTQYDKAAGTISVAPDTAVKTRYQHDYYRKGRYVGYESSITVVDHYAFLGDNAGMFHCIDLNTMELVWAQDLIDDINATAAFDWGEDGRGYLYIAPSLDYSNGGERNDLPICKLDAQTGEIIWTHYLNCRTADEISGGALASPLLGRAGTDMEDMVIFSIGRTPGFWSGYVIAINKHTGEIIWQTQTNNYMWSSPVGVYDENGKGYIFQGDASGNCYLIDGATGKILDTIALKETIEASPVVFGDKIVIGTRSDMVLIDIN